MMIPDSPAERLARARSYPFGHPRLSFLFRGGTAAALSAVPDGLLDGRVPVLASGSNAAPAQLARKFAAHGDRAVIPVTRVHLAGFDSVYNAHIAAYGSVPATLFPSPGTVLTTFITWLDEDQLEIMHATEQPGVNYHFVELSGLEAEVDGVGGLETAFAYISVAGCLRHDGAPVSLAEVAARNRRFPALTQPEVLGLVRDRTAPSAELDPFILELVADAGIRAARAAILESDAMAFAHPGLRIVPLDPPQALSR